MIVMIDRSREVVCNLPRNCRLRKLSNLKREWHVYQDLDQIQRMQAMIVVDILPLYIIHIQKSREKNLIKKKKKNEKKGKENNNPLVD